MDIRASRFMLLVLPFCWWELGDAYSKSTATAADLKGSCSPIVLSPGSINTIITRKLFTEKDYEIAILPSQAHSEDSFWAYIIRNAPNGYRCETKRIMVSDVMKGNSISPDLVVGCKVEIRSKAIDEQSVRILSNLLRDQVSKAAYLRNNRALGVVDGQTYDVYVKGRPEDPYREYSGCIIDPFKKDSRSCSTITYVLAHLVLSDDDKTRADPLNKLIKYLKNVADGKLDGVDPFVEKQESTPDVLVPPL